MRRFGPHLMVFKAYFWFCVSGACMWCGCHIFFYRHCHLLITSLVSSSISKSTYTSLHPRFKWSSLFGFSQRPLGSPIIRPSHRYTPFSPSGGIKYSVAQVTNPLSGYRYCFPKEHIPVLVETQMASSAPLTWWSHKRWEEPFGTRTLF